VGILAAACMHALDHHVGRLAEDHRRARALAQGLHRVPGVTVTEPDTNIVYASLEAGAPDARAVLEGLAARGVRMLDFGPRLLRAVTHLDVDDAGVDRAIAAFHDVVAARAGAPARRA